VVPESFVRQAYKDHARILRQPPTEQGPSLEELKPYLDEIFASANDFKITNKSWLEPSLSASYGVPRSKGGGFHEISNRLVFDQGRDWEYDYLGYDELIGMYYSPVKGLFVLRGLIADLSLSTLYKWFNHASCEDERAVQVHAVTEPLKCRLITKAPAFQTFGCHPLQKFIWKHLYTLKPFVLLGEPVTSLLLDKYIPLESGEFLTSGDYKAATDGLNINVTKLVMEYLIIRLNLDDTMANLARSILYEQRLEYPATSGVETCMQQNGQLMGSILSFPVLCIVNLLGYWISLDKSKSTHTCLDDLRVVINGDDILFPCDDSQYSCWLTTIEHLGFKLSIGKNYTHPKVCTVNSQCFYLNEGSYEPIGFLNTGLLTGQSKKSGRDDIRTLPSRDYYNEVVHSSHNPVRTHCRFLHYNIEEIRQVTGNGQYNLFGDRDCGGLGFKSPGSYTSTNFQRKFSRYLRECITRRVCKERKPFRLALLQDTCKSRPLLPRRDRFIWIPSISNYDTICKDNDNSQKLPILITPGPIDREKSITRVRLPDKKILQAFRRISKNRELRDRDQVTSHVKLCALPNIIRGLPLNYWQYNIKQSSLFSSSILPGWERKTRIEQFLW
jgi:hypothetical protein